MSLEQYRGMLAIQPHRLDEELEIQAMIQDRIANQRAIANAKQLEAKDILARKESRIADELREDDPKLTVGGVNGKVARDPERLKAWDHYQACRTEFESWDGLYESWKTRGYKIRDLADLWIAQYYTTDSYTSKATASAGNDERRAAMRRNHQDRHINVAAAANENSRAQRSLVDDDDAPAPRRRRVVE